MSIDALGFVYFIQAGPPDQPIKIGWSGNPSGRIKGIQTTVPRKLVFLGVTQGTCKDEKRLHKQFANARLHGEWFSPVPELLEFIKANVRIDYAEAKATPEPAPRVREHRTGGLRDVAAHRILPEDLDRWRDQDSDLESRRFMAAELEKHGLTNLLGFFPPSSFAVENVCTVANEMSVGGTLDVVLHEFPMTIYGWFGLVSALVSAGFSKALSDRFALRIWHGPYKYPPHNCMKMPDGWKTDIDGSLCKVIDRR